MERVKKLLLAQGVDAGEVKAIEKRAKKEVDTAVEESKVCLGGRRGRLTGFDRPVFCFEPVKQRARQLSKLARPASSRMWKQRCGPRARQPCQHRAFAPPPLVTPAQPPPRRNRNAAPQSAAPPPLSWQWKNVYHDPLGIKLRTTTGGYVTPTYDPAYALP